MKEVTVAKSAGFCFGVKKAVDTVYEEIKKGTGPVFTFGPVIHNEEVVKDLEGKGVRVLHSLAELKALHSGTVIIRSHGVGREVYEICRRNGLHVVDATCPFVKKIHRIAEEKTKEGTRVYIVGNPHHPEVEGIRGWGDGKTTVIESAEDFLSQLPEPGGKVCIVSQTTFNLGKFQEIVDKITNLGYDIECCNTICSATQERQNEAENIASRVDAMIVIGGKESSNTGKLVEICRGKCSNTIFIQTYSDLDPEALRSVYSIGITAGASTPKHIIEEVQANVRSEF